MRISVDVVMYDNECVYSIDLPVLGVRPGDLDVLDAVG